MVDVYGGSKVFQQNVRLPMVPLAASTSMSGSGAGGVSEVSFPVVSVTPWIPTHRKCTIR